MLSLTCTFCSAKAQFHDRRSGQYLCLEHGRLEVAAARQRPDSPLLTIRPAAPGDYGHIEELALHFWDETEVDCLDRQYDVLACPAFLACEGDHVVGTASCVIEPGWDAIVLVMLNILPSHQGQGGGRALLDAVRDEGQRLGLSRILVVTSNDDLPALALYQRYGFRITDVLPGRIAQHHGGDVPGFAGIPVRDEIRLECRL